jgi:DNA-binding winged helix-turn-helix (wHTH) protein
MKLNDRRAREAVSARPAREYVVKLMISKASAIIDLAKEPSFRIGDLAIDPPRRKIGTPEGVERLIEPKLLQALILLYRERNTPVSRNELMAGCWCGRFVSSDAIERVIGRLRKLAAELAPGNFRIITINKFGYELVIEEKIPLLTDRPSAKQGFSLRPLMAAVGARTRIITASGITVCLAFWLSENYFSR